MLKSSTLRFIVSYEYWHLTRNPLSAISSCFPASSLSFCQGVRRRSSTQIACHLSNSSKVSKTRVSANTILINIFHLYRVVTEEFIYARYATWLRVKLIFNPLQNVNLPELDRTHYCITYSVLDVNKTRVWGVLWVYASVVKHLGLTLTARMEFYCCSLCVHKQGRSHEASVMDLCVYVSSNLTNRSPLV